MKLIIEIDDRDFSALKDSLRMTTEQYRSAWSKQDELVASILRARQALGLSVSESDVCTDYTYKGPDFASCNK